jgi:hypothetical protein
MTKIQWPVILSGDYSDGSVCNAADYKADFEKMRDAVNQLFERFSSFMIYGQLSSRKSATDVAPAHSGGAADPGGTASEAGGPQHVLISDTAYQAWTFYNIGDGPQVNENVRAVDARRRNIVTIFKVPAWMQGLRIRGIGVQNRSNLAYDRRGDNAWVGFKYSRPKFGISVGESLDSFYWLDANTHNFVGGGGATAAVDIQAIEFGLGSVSDNAPSGADFATGQTFYTVQEELGGPNYMNGVTNADRDSNFALNPGSAAAALPGCTAPVYKEAACDYVVEPGEYIALWASGDIKVLNDTGTTLISPFILDYQISVLCDTMVPVP